MVLLLVLFPHYVPLPFYSYALVCFLALLYYLRRSGESLRSLGLQRDGVRPGTVAVGLLSALVWVAFMRWVYGPLIAHFFTVPDYTEYDFIRGSVQRLAMTLVAAWVVGGFYEEVVFRGFIQSIFEKHLGGRRGAFWLSAVAASILFGLYHWQQGIFGVVAATLGGLYWSCVLRLLGRNLWRPILSHALYDTIALVLIYLGLFNR